MKIKFFSFIFLNRYWKTPQIIFTINQSNLIENNSTSCLVIVNLMQKYSRQKRVAFSIQSADEYIQFGLYKVIGGEKVYLKYFEQTKSVKNIDLEFIGSSGLYLNQREVSAKFSLSAGVYIVIPSTYHSEIEGEFLIRVFTQIY